MRNLDSLDGIVDTAGGQFYLVIRGWVKNTVFVTLVGKSIRAPVLSFSITVQGNVPSIGTVARMEAFPWGYSSFSEESEREAVQKTAEAVARMLGS